MIRSRTAQLVLQSAYMALGLLAVVSTFGIFEATFRLDAYVLFTNQCNFLCLGIMIAELVQTAKKREDGFVSVSPLLKFVGLVGIVLTAAVFYAMLAGTRDPASNFRVGTILMHLVLPLMYFADWALFYEKGTVKFVYPLVSAILPFAYVVFIYLHAAILGFDTSIQNFNQNGPFIYPYFFLNIEKIGVGGVAKWCAVLLAAFIVVGYLLLGIDRLLYGIRGKKRRGSS